MKKWMIQLVWICFIPSLFSCVHNESAPVKTISPELMKDKIGGGWAGKMIGVTYGAPTEFKAQGKIFEDPVSWEPSDVRGAIWQDDIYVQLTFLMAMDQYGVDAPAKKLQELFAKADYKLWHANVQARKNYFDSIFPPQSGHPDFNLHADDIDFQIESDYIGFMCPGMPRTATAIADRVGHIMNYGDGVYGGIFVAALYSEAFFETNIPRIIEKALLSIPGKSDYAKIVNDVVLLHSHYPDDWRSAWAELQEKWGSVQICGAGSKFNIDAKLNGAYIVMGLLYGDGDPVKTLEITTRCGQDSDCNPSNAMAVLGVINGFSSLPDAYQEAVKAIGDSLFSGTSYSFNKAVDKTMEVALKLIGENGGNVKGKKIEIAVQQPQPLPLEVSFPKLVFSKRSTLAKDEGWKMKGTWQDFGNGQSRFSGNAGDEVAFEFEGSGISLTGNWIRDGGKADIFVDDKFIRTIDTYFFFSHQEHRNMDLFHITGLNKGIHVLKLVVKGEKRPEAEGTNVCVSGAVVFDTADKTSENFKYSFQ